MDEKAHGAAAQTGRALGFLLWSTQKLLRRQTDKDHDSMLKAFCRTNIEP